MMPEPDYIVRDGKKISFENMTAEEANALLDGDWSFMLEPMGEPRCWAVVERAEVGLCETCAASGNTHWWTTDGEHRYAKPTPSHDYLGPVVRRCGLLEGDANTEFDHDFVEEPVEAQP